MSQNLCRGSVHGGIALPFSATSPFTALGKRIDVGSDARFMVIVGRSVKPSLGKAMTSTSESTPRSCEKRAIRLSAEC